MKINRLVLASTSPYRLALLEKAGLNVTPLAPLADEGLVDAVEPLALAQARCELKGVSLALQDEPFLAIAADQVLEFEGQAYGKAGTPEEALQRLKRFRGRSHLLHSAYCLVYHDSKQQLIRILSSRVVTAEMTMRRLADDELAGYLATGEWQGCAGCYQYEHQGVHLFDAVVGDVSTIIGLPLLPLLEDLRSLGINPLLHKQGPWTLQTF